MNGLDYSPVMPKALMVAKRDGRVLLLHPHAPRWAVVNATGMEVVRRCDGCHTVAQIAEAIAGPYGLPAEAIQADVEACLEGLQRAGFLASAIAPHPKPAGRHGAGRSWQLHLYVTGKCNLRCRHCAVMGKRAPPDRLSAAVLRDLIDQAVAGGAGAVAFSGGESLLRPDLPELLTYSAGRIKTILATNGTLIDEPLAARLVELGVLVQISLDGATAEVHDSIRGSGAFACAWRGIERLQRAGIGVRLALNVTLMRGNIGQVAAMVDLAAARGVPGLRFMPLQRMGRAAEVWDELAPSPDEYAAAYRYLYLERPANGVAVNPGLPGLELDPPDEGMWCRLGRLLVVDAKGDIYPCSLLMDAQFRLGNVDRDGLANAIASPLLRELANLCEQRQNGIESCRGCSWRHFCQGGCPGCVWLEHDGVWHAVDQHCDLKQELFPQLLFASPRVAGSPSA